MVEVALATTLLAVVGMIVAENSRRMRIVNTTADWDARLQAQCTRAMHSINRDLCRALYQPDAGNELPYVFDDGVAEAPYDTHSHVPAQSEALAGEPDFGPNREIVFLLPEDADDDGRPDLDLDGVVWSPDEISYTVITDATGNALIRSVDNADPQIVARFVERVVFDTPKSCGYAIPLGTLRVRLYFRARGTNGELYRYQAETVLRLQPMDS